MTNIDPNPPGPEAAAEEPTPTQRRAMGLAVLTSTAGSLTNLALQYGVILLYLTAQHLSSARIIFVLAVAPVVDAALRVPLAGLADRWGKKRIGIIGISLQIVGVAMLTVSGFFEPRAREWLTTGGIAVYAAGLSSHSSSWFALLMPIVPEPVRGRFFGRLRTSWQTVGLVFAIACAAFLSQESPIGAFQVVMAVMLLGHILMLVFYSQIPEFEHATGEPLALRAALAEILRADGFMSFCAYVFLLSLFTTGCPMLFALIEKRVLNLGDNAVVWLGNLGMIGALAGFYLGGKAVDHFGTKPVFLVAHFGYGVVLVMFLFRVVDASWVLPVVALANFAFSFVWAASSIALTTEMLALVPAENKSLSTSVCMTLMRAGSALSAIIAGALLKLGVLKETWTFAGRTLSQYDAILLGFAVMVILMVVTLGLVPSVLRKAEWVPR